jgi:type I restriction enzyme R subunit
VVETRAFTECPEDAITRYLANAITTAEVIQELIQQAEALSSS